VLLAWSTRPSPVAVGAGCALLATASITRFAGLMLIPIALLFLLIRRTGWVGFGCGALGLALPLIGYATWVKSGTEQFGLSTRAPYGKVATFAECRGIELPRYERQLCIDEPLSERARSYSYWNRNSPLRTLETPPEVDESAVISSFTRRMILRQPVDYAASVAGEFLYFFSPASPQEMQPIRAARWQFPVMLDDLEGIPPSVRQNPGAPPPQLGLDDRLAINESLGSALRGYQSLVYARGPCSLYSVFWDCLPRPSDGRTGRGPAASARRACSWHWPA
jgi:hypothetical protein